MKKKILAISLVALAACRERPAQNADSALAADLALASQLQASRPIPQFQDSAPRAETPTPSARTEAPRAQAPRVSQRIENAPRVRVTPRQPVVTQPVEAVQPQAAQPAREAASQPGPSIGAGASFALASQQRICTASNRAGDRFVATVSNTIAGSNGGSIPAGATVVLEVASVGEDAIGFTVHSVELNGRNYPVSGDVYSTGELERVRLNPESDRKKVIGGAVAGALIGQIMKKNTKGTVIGAAAGAATGAVAAKMTEKYDNCLPVGAPMRLTLSNAILM